MVRHTEDGAPRMTAPNPLPAVSSVAEQIRPYVSDTTVVPPDGLPYWLSGLSVPIGGNQTAAGLSSPQPARVLLCHSVSGGQAWDGCEVINLFRFTGTVPVELVHHSADRTLRDLGAATALTYRPRTPPDSGITAVRSRGPVIPGPRRIWAQFTNYLVAAGDSGALLEHSILVGGAARRRLARMVGELSDAVHNALLASVGAARQISGGRGYA
jgi:hypothetical protein